MATLNAQSACNKHDYIHHIVNDQNIDILTMTETWFSPKSQYEAAAITPNGYSLLCEDRPGEANGGGVAILCKEEYKPRKIKNLHV
jgi:hypothetical protein